MRKKLILFDWGNIVESHLTGYSFRDALNDLFRACGYTGNKNIFDTVSKHKICSISTLENFEIFYNEIAKELGLSATYLEFVRLYLEIHDKIDYYVDVANYEKSLKDKCYIGILSNLTILDKERINKQVDLSKYDYVFLSFELGLEKPDMKIYERVQSEVPFAPSDILFIDDLKANVDAASKMGWNTLQATGLELDKIKEKCNSFLVND